MEEIECHTRAYLLYLVGSTISSTTTGNKVPVMYLPLFENFDEAGKYAWGAATLSFLYRALGNASLRSQNTISGSLTLLQCWSYYHLNVGRPKLNHDPIHECFPFVLRWKGKPSSPTSNRDVAFYRKAMDSMEPSDVDWCPYSNISHTVIPDHILRSLILGRSKTMLICYDKAERHLADRCLRQFGMHQTVPEEVQKWERKSRGVDGGVDLSTKMESELSEWSNRHLYIVEAEEDVEESEYMQWYLNITRKLVGRPIPISSEFQRMNAALREIAHIADTLSTHGMDDQQLQSVSRIQYIAYECLRDQITNTVVAANSQSEVEKRVRGKERVRRKGPGKRKRKNEIDQYYTAGITVQSRLPAATFDADHAHLYHVSNEVDDPHLCLTVSEGDHVRMSHVAQSVDDMEFCEDDNEVDESHFHHVAEVDGQFSSELAEDKPHASIDIVPRASRETREDVAQQNDYGVLV